MAAVLCAKPPPPPPPPLPEPPTTIPVENHHEQSNQLEFINLSSSFGNHGMQNTCVPRPNAFPTMLSLPPPPSQSSFYPSSNDSIPVFHSNIAPPKPLPPPPTFYGPPPTIIDSQEAGFSTSNMQQTEEVSMKHNQLPPDFKINQPPPDFKADQLPPDFTVEKPPPQLNFTEMKANNSGSSSPIGAIRYDQETEKVEPIRNPFSIDRKFPTNNNATDSFLSNPQPSDAFPSYTNPFAKPSHGSQMFSQNQTAPNRFQSVPNYAPPNPLPQAAITSVPPPNAMFQFRAPPMFGGPPQQPLPLSSPNPLHSIPPPKPLQLNKIPAPKELDLNAIPEPKLNLEAIKVPDGSDISRG